MTLYSLLPAQNKVAVIATWAGEDAESYSKKVSTFTDQAQAARVADRLTRTSEGMWDAAAWLDTYETAETFLADLVGKIRDANDIPAQSDPLFAGCRHNESWTSLDMADLLSYQLADTCNTLNRAQRLSVADELEADAQARRDSLALLPTGFDPDDSSSRLWQAADITRATKLGLVGPLPDGAAGWLVRAYDTRGPAERWGARQLIARLEQLQAAAQSVRGRGSALLDDLTNLPKAHLVFPAELFGVDVDDEYAPVVNSNPITIDPNVAGSALAERYREACAGATNHSGDAVVAITPRINAREISPWQRDTFAEVQILLTYQGRQFELASIAPTDTSGFVEALGVWVKSVNYTP